jgi:hypothetical protein
MLTAYHAKYFAHELTKRHSADDLEKLTGTLADAQVDLNPHQHWMAWLHSIRRVK